MSVKFCHGKNVKLILHELEALYSQTSFRISKNQNFQLVHEHVYCINKIN